jgi:hypothetical protein
MPGSTRAASPTASALAILARKARDDALEEVAQEFEAMKRKSSAIVIRSHKSKP